MVWDFLFVGIALDFTTVNVEIWPTIFRLDSFLLRGIFAFKAKVVIRLPKGRLIPFQCVSYGSH